MPEAAPPARERAGFRGRTRTLTASRRRAAADSSETSPMPPATAEIIHGDAIEELRRMPDASIDAIVTDPPYGLSELKPATVAKALAAWAAGDLGAMPAARGGFMNASWDSFVPPPALWAECLRVLKPGGHVAAFAGARTQDLMGLSLRLAGFEIRDSLAWIRSDQFAKGAKLPGGLATSMKPGHEPILLARRPLQGSAAANVAEWGAGALNADAVRVPYASEADRAESEGKNRHADYGTAQGGNRVYGDYSKVAARKNHDGSAGRTAPNVLLDEDAAAEIDRLAPPHPVHGLGPSRFFPVVYSGRASNLERPTLPDGTGHPSVKPLSVMRWAIRLIVPSGGTVLDPFAGSGTTLEAAFLEGVPSIGIEREADYLPLIEQRLERCGAR